ncbi:MAG: sugar ABC transporter permease [Alphaproteobacteria bacterium]
MTMTLSGGPAGVQTLQQRARQIALATGIDTRLIALMSIMAVVWVALDAATGGVFLSARNLFNLSVQFAVVGIMATGMVLVIVTRNIDISVGSLLGFIGVCGALLQVRSLGLDDPNAWWITTVAMVAGGVLLGLINGLVVAYLRVPALIVTLAGLMFYRNAAYQVTEGVTIAPLDETFQIIGGGLNGTIGETWSWIVGAAAVAAIAWGTLATRRRRRKYGFPLRHPAMEAAMIAFWSLVVLVFVNTMNNYNKPNTEEPMGIAVPVLILFGVAATMSFIAKRTRFGRYIYAIGGNPDSAELVGIDTRKVVVSTFTLMGFLAGLAAVVVTARLNAATNATGIMTELQVIAAAVVGGTSLAGGLGTIFGAVLGALFIQSLESGMVLLRLDSPVQKMVIAVVLVSAVVIDMAFRRKRS